MKTYLSDNLPNHCKPPRMPITNRFIGTFQGISVDAGTDAAGEALDIAESLLANDGFVASEIAPLLSRSGECCAAAPLWRAIPFGLYYFKEPDKLREHTIAACRLTHQETTQVAACYGMALAVATLLQAAEVEPLGFLRELSRLVREVDQNAYTRILGLKYSIRKELPFICTDHTQTLEIFRASLYLFLTCYARDIENDARSHSLKESPALPLAYSLAGSSGRFCRIEKPSLRLVMIAEAFHKATAAE